MGGLEKRSRASGSLQVSEDMALQRRTWTVERIGWIVIALIMLAALLGLFSDGPLSGGAARDAAGLVTVEYDRFARYMAPSTLRVAVSGAESRDGAVTVRMNRAFAEAIEIQHIHPLPMESRTLADGLTFAFHAAGPEWSGILLFDFRPRRTGLLRGELGLAGRAPARFTQFVYP